LARAFTNISAPVYSPMFAPPFHESRKPLGETPS
jgi:hypothetical protein